MVLLLLVSAAYLSSVESRRLSSRLRESKSARISASASSEDSSDEETGKPYEFEYVVNTHPVNNAHSRKEVSNGNVVKGEYRVRMSDGRTQIVR